jgi:flagellar biosynthesis protein FlhA
MLANMQPVILVHPVLRGKLRKFLERYIQGVTIISHNEIPPQIKIQSVGVVRINES